MDLGGPIVAGSGGEDVIEWGRLKSLNVRTFEVVVIGRVHEARQPFYSMQTMSEGGVRVDFETKVGGTRGVWASSKRKLKMPEDTDRFVLNYEGKRYVCWRGGWGPPPADPPGSVTDGGTPGTPGEPGSGVPGTGNNPPVGPDGRPGVPTPGAGTGAGAGAGSVPVPDAAGGLGAGEAASGAIPGAAVAIIRMPTVEDFDPRPEVDRRRERRRPPRQDGPSPPPLLPAPADAAWFAFSVIPSAWSLDIAWQLPGLLDTDIGFETSAVHQTLGPCCVTGRITEIDSDIAQGIRLSAVFGTVSISLTAFEGFDGTASVSASFCNGAISGTQQVDLNVSIERLMTITIRNTFLTFPAGPLRFEGGIAGRIDHAQFELGSGSSVDMSIFGGASTPFWGSSIGPFVQGRLKLGRWEASVSLEMSAITPGVTGPEPGRPTVATGVACRF